MTAPFKGPPASACRWLSILAAAPVAAVSVLRAVPAELPVLGVQLVSFVPWLAVPATAAVLLAVPARSRLLQLGAVGLLAAQLFWLFPADISRPAPGTDGKPAVSVVAMNLNAELGGADAGTIVELVRNHRVNLLTIEEYTQALEDKLSGAGLQGLLPHRVSHPRERAGGIAVYSSFELQEAGLVPDTPFRMPVVRLDLGTAGNGAALQVVAVHALAPVGDAVAQWRSDIAAVAKADTGSGPLLLAGDFNATYDHREFRALLTGSSGGRKLVDVAASLGRRLVPTWPMRGYPLPGVTLDHLVTSPDVAASGYSVHRVSGTDHAAVMATLQIPSS